MNPVLNEDMIRMLTYGSGFFLVMAVVSAVIALRESRKNRSRRGAVERSSGISSYWAVVMAGAASLAMAAFFFSLAWVAFQALFIIVAVPLLVLIGVSMVRHWRGNATYNEARWFDRSAWKFMDRRRDQTDDEK